MESGVEVKLTLSGVEWIKVGMLFYKGILINNKKYLNKSRTRTCTRRDHSNRRREGSTSEGRKGGRKEKKMKIQ